MINLKNTCVLVRTKEENEKLLKEAEKQGFNWSQRYDCKPLLAQHFPDILRFYEDKVITYEASIRSNVDFYEASELLGTKEMTAREFAEWIADIGKCGERKCAECVLNKMNTECSFNLCIPRNWKNNIDELLEIAKSSRITVPTPEEKAIEDIEKLIQSPYRGITGEIKESLKLAVEKLKEVNDNGEINT